MIKKMFRVVTCLVLGVCSMATAEKMFTICAIPDTQRGQQNTAPMMTWIGQNKAALNIVAVISLGDMTDGNTVTEWDHMLNAYENVLWQTYGIPYAPCMGNHDSNSIYQSGLGEQNAFPVSLLEPQGMMTSTMEGQSDNAIYKFSIYGLDCTIAVVSGYDNDDAASVTFAKNAFAELNSGDIGILTTHDPAWVNYFNGSTPNLDLMWDGHVYGNNAVGQYSDFKQYVTGHYSLNGAEDWRGRATVYTFYPDQNKVSISSRGVNGEVFYQYPDITLTMDATSDNATVIYGDSVAEPNDASFVSQSTPLEVQPGGSFDVNVTMENTGTNTWTLGNGYFLGSVGDDNTWGATRASLTNDVAPGSEATFTIHATAVSTTGAYNLQWQMLQDGVEWFGNTANIAVSVGPQDMHIEAEAFSLNSGFQTEATGDVGGGSDLGFTDLGDYAEYSVNVTHAGAYNALFRVASDSQNIRLDLKEGTNVLCAVDATTTSGWQTWKTVTNLVALSSGQQTLTIYAAAGGWNINWFEFIPLDNVPPQITSTPPDSYIDVGEAFSYTVTATDAESDPVTLTAETKPAWLTFAENVLTGTPAVGDIGTHSITLRASDTNSFSEQSFTIHVSAAGNDAPVITSVPVTGVIENQGYSYTLTATDPDNDLLTYIDITSPAWMTLSGNVLSGTAPAGNSLDSVELAVSDGTVSVTQDFNVAVFVTPLPPNLLVNGSFETGDSAGWTVTAPTEVSVSMDTTSDGTYAVKLVPEGDGYVPNTSQSVAVQTNTEYTLTYDVLREAGSAGALVVRAIDNDSRYIDYNPTSGWESRQIVFNSGANTSINFSFWMDGGATNISYLDNFVLAGPSGGNVAPVFTSVPVTNATVDVLYNYTLLAADANDDTLAFSSVTLPTGFVLSNGVLSGTPTEAGDLSVELSVSDGTTSTSQSFVIAVTGGATGYEAWAVNEGVNAGDTANLLEYALDGDTTTYGDSEPAITKEGGTLKYVHPQRSDDPNLSYTVQTCDDLTIGSWQDATVDAVTNVTGSNYNVVTNTIPTAAAQTYIRLKVENQ